MSEPLEGAPPSPAPADPDPPRSLWRDVRAAFSLVLDSPLVFNLLCALCFVTAYLLQVGADVQSLAFLDSRQPRIWHVLFTLQPTLWVINTFIIWSDFRSHRLLWPRTRRERMTVILCTFVNGLMIALPFFAQFSNWRTKIPLNALGPVSSQEFHSQALTASILGVAVAMLHAMSLFCVHVQLLGLSPEAPSPGGEAGAGDLEEDVRLYLRLRALSRRFLGLSAFAIGTSLLGIGILRNLLNQAHASRPELFPAEPVVSYGIYFTGLIASEYLPLRKTLSDVGEALAKRLLRQTLGDRATWKERAEEQRAARTYLGLHESALQELQQGLSVLAPLLASIFSLVLGTGQ